MRLVRDTNVVVSATLWRGTTYQFLELVRRQSDSIRVFASAPLLTELAEVLVRPAMTPRLAAISRNAADVLGDYAALVEIIEPMALQGVSPDPDDDVVVAAALAARADFIVTGDKDLLGVGRFGQVEFLSVAEAATRFLG